MQYISVVSRDWRGEEGKPMAKAHVGSIKKKSEQVTGYGFTKQHF